MKQKNNYRYLLVGLVMALVSSAVMLSCKDDDPSLAELRDDKIAYLADSLRVSDSLRRLNQAGVVNYAVTVVSGSTSTLFRQEESRTSATKDIVEGALVTISQFGKVVTDTTDASGMVVLNGFFRGAVNVTVRKEDFTTAAFVIAVKLQDSTANGTINFVGNLLPIFETTGANTATVSGVAKIQSDLTNTTRENAPAGTTLIAHIDAMDDDFISRFLSMDPVVDDTGPSVVVLNGAFLEAAYSTGVVGTVAADGTYTITVPSAIDGLQTMFEYSEIALNRVRFEDGDDVNSSNRTMTERTIYSPYFNATAIPAGGGVDITFDAGSGAVAAANITQVGTIETATVTAGGSGYTGTPLVRIDAAVGSGATATAVVTNGVVTGVNIVNKGSGYTTTSPPTITFLSGTTGAASAALDVNGGTVLSVSVGNSGAGYTSAPTVTFSGGGTPTTIATATAILSGGRVTAINVTNPGVGYSSAPTVALTGGGFTTAATATANFSGVGVASVNLTNPGQNYNYAPSVTFDPPQVPNGVRATGIATVDASSGRITGIQITNAGSGYTAIPNIALNAGTGAAATPYLTGASINSINVTNQGNNYVAAPTVKITPNVGFGGTGATATATVVGGKLTAINVTNGGIGYTPGQVTIELISGEGAEAHATIGANGAVTGIRMITQGSGYTGAPIVTIDGSGMGNGATATATITNGQVTGVTVTNGGSGYVEGNTPTSQQNFNAMIQPYTTFWIKTGMKYINDVYYGTGLATPN